MKKETEPQPRYTEETKEYTIAYIKDKLQRIEVRFQKEDYENRILPAIEKSGLPVSTYIKKAIDEKIEREASDWKSELEENDASCKNI